MSVDAWTQTPRVIASGPLLGSHTVVTVHTFRPLTRPGLLYGTGGAKVGNYTPLKRSASLYTSPDKQEICKLSHRGGSGGVRGEDGTWRRDGGTLLMDPVPPVG